MRFFKKLRLARNAALLLAAAFALAPAAQGGRINWYFSKPGGNARPSVLDGKYDPASYGALFLGPEGEKKIYLTFDAGYANENLEKILDVLEKHEAKAAFFILPGIIRNSRSTVQRMIDGGHTLCNHSTHHGDISKLTDKAALKAELEGVENAYREAFGLELSRFFRPPEGAFSVKALELLRELGYTPVFWSYAYADWDNSKQPDPAKSKAALLDAAHDGMVLLLHPTSATNAAILDSLLTEWEKQGYTFGTLDELKSKTG
ncbi:MAG: polysaccharide deacetylase family protein [Clostridia bacterium]|nr:polysaccharide deacetylase family protein [Clostridia bacterium]